MLSPSFLRDSVERVIDSFGSNSSLVELIENHGNLYWVALWYIKELKLSFTFLKPFTKEVFKNTNLQQINGSVTKNRVYEKKLKPTLDLSSIEGDSIVSKKEVNKKILRFNSTKNIWGSSNIFTGSANIVFENKQKDSSESDLSESFDLKSTVTKLKEKRLTGPLSSRHNKNSII